jgi:hypothetical protein
MLYAHTVRLATGRRGGDAAYRSPWVTSSFLVLLGSWKVLGAVALLVPRRPLLKEWAYAGAYFTYTGAIVSHLTTGYALNELPLLGVLTALTVLSWALRPPSRRT